MIFGRIEITDTAVETHKDSYKTAQLSVVSARRPFLPLSLLITTGGSAFGWQFFDLLYPAERAGLGILISASLIAGTQLGQLQLLSRDLRGSELSGVIWGTYGHLNRIRRDIMKAMQVAAQREV